MRLLISVMRALVTLLMLVAFYFYELDETLLEQFEADLNVRRERQTASSNAEA